VTSICCWGIFREREHSPGRETDDTEILRLTAKHLEAKGFQVFLKTPEDVSVAIDPRPSCAFLMCERLGVLELLGAWEASGIQQVNRPEAILNTYRERMITLLADAGVPFIASRVVTTREPGPVGALPVWVKRADVHNTQPGDVVLAEDASAVNDALGALAARGIDRAVLQPHVDGDLIKFYGVGVPGEPAVRAKGQPRAPGERGPSGGPSQSSRSPDSELVPGEPAVRGEGRPRTWGERGARRGPSESSRSPDSVAVRGEPQASRSPDSVAVRGEPQASRSPDSEIPPTSFRWFYHRDQVVAGHPVDPGELAQLVHAAAGALGLEVYGGDAIATPRGLVLLDVNAWPSFALYREEAAAEIAAYLARRFSETGA